MKREVAVAYFKDSAYFLKKQASSLLFQNINK